jgi:hypothetical protein
MICPLLSSGYGYTSCQGSSCGWWDEIRQCCAVIPVNFGHMMKQAAKARLDSDVELSGGPVE